MGRERIYPYSGRRARFTGTFVEFSREKRGFRQTAILIDVHDQRGELVADHVWLADAAPFVDVGAVEGDIVAFSARCRLMVRGYYEHDRHLPISRHYTLEAPRSVRVVERVGEPLEVRKSSRRWLNGRHHRRPRYKHEYESEEEDA